MAELLTAAVVVIVGVVALRMARRWVAAGRQRDEDAFAAAAARVGAQVVRAPEGPDQPQVHFRHAGRDVVLRYWYRKVLTDWEFVAVDVCLELPGGQTFRLGSGLPVASEKVKVGDPEFEREWDPRGDSTWLNHLLTPAVRRALGEFRERVGHRGGFSWVDGRWHLTLVPGTVTQYDDLVLPLLEGALPVISAVVESFGLDAD